MLQRVDIDTELSELSIIDSYLSKCVPLFKYETYQHVNIQLSSNFRELYYLSIFDIQMSDMPNLLCLTIK